MRQRNKSSPILPRHHPTTGTHPLDSSTPSKARTFLSSTSSSLWQRKRRPPTVLPSVDVHDGSSSKGILPKCTFLSSLLLLLFGLGYMASYAVFHDSSPRIVPHDTAATIQNRSNSQSSTTSSFIQYHDGQYGTVMGLGADYDLKTYQQFVGSLRKTGYKGNIILGVAQGNMHTYHDDNHQKILSYLRDNHVTVNIIPVQDCMENSGGVCLDGLLDGASEWNLSWGYYFLLRKWLKECLDCSTGPVLLVSVPGTTFLQSPFALEEKSYNDHDHGHDNLPFRRLELYETPLSTDHWKSATFLQKCVRWDWDVPLISSSIVQGDRMSILFYLEAMLGEMIRWKEGSREDCDSKLLHRHGNGHGHEEMFIHNYLFYNGDILATTVHSPSTTLGFVKFVSDSDSSKAEMDNTKEVKVIMTLEEAP